MPFQQLVREAGTVILSALSSSSTLPRCTEGRNHGGPERHPGRDFVLYLTVREIRSLPVSNMKEKTSYTLPLPVKAARYTCTQDTQPITHETNAFIQTDCYRLITITWQCRHSLCFWQSPNMLSTGVQLGPVALLVVITTDASLMGWRGSLRGTHNERSVGRIRKSSNALELETIRLALLHFTCDKRRFGASSEERT